MRSPKRSPSDESCRQHRMYEIPGFPNCPVASFEKYVAKLSLGCDAFWQKPKSATTGLLFKESDACWYYSTSLGKNTMYSMMKSLSMAAKLSTVYTNCCLRVTPMTNLDLCRFKVARENTNLGPKLLPAVPTTPNVSGEAISQPLLISVPVSVLPPLSMPMNPPTIPQNAVNFDNKLVTVHLAQSSLEVKPRNYQPPNSQPVEPPRQPDTQPNSTSISSLENGSSVVYSFAGKSVVMNFNNCIVNIYK